MLFLHVEFGLVSMVVRQNDFLSPLSEQAISNLKNLQGWMSLYCHWDNGMTPATVLSFLVVPLTTHATA